MSAPRDIWKKVSRSIFLVVVVVVYTWEDMQRIQVPPDVQSTEVRLRCDQEI